MRKTITAIVTLDLLAVALMAGPVVEDNPKGLETRRLEIAQAQWQSSTNYLSESNFVVMVESAKNFADLQAAVLAKAKSDADKADKENKAKGKK